MPGGRRIVVIGVAVSIAVAVAASRVLLDYHWLSDVVGGLALGWGWFALCAVVFGGRLLRPTAAVDVAASTATKTSRRRRAEVHISGPRRPRKPTYRGQITRQSKTSLTNYVV